MQFWVEQLSGPHRERIDAVRDAWRQGQLSDKEAWNTMSILYHRCRRRDPPVWTTQGTNVAFMLDMWFPKYANMWFSGTERACRDAIRRFILTPDGQFAIWRICSEY